MKNKNDFFQKSELFKIMPFFRIFSKNVFSGYIDIRP